MWLLNFFQPANFHPDHRQVAGRNGRHTAPYAAPAAPGPAVVEAHLVLWLVIGIELNYSSK